MNIKSMLNKKVKKILVAQALKKLDTIESKEAPEGYLNLFNSGIKLEIGQIRIKACKIARTLIENYRRKI